LTKKKETDIEEETKTFGSKESEDEVLDK